MRTRNQQFYDHFYYWFERKYSVFFSRLITWKKLLRVKFDKSFYDFYKNEMVPYWAQFGAKPHLAMVKQTYLESGGCLDKRYIPDDVWELNIIPHFNDLRFARLLPDKNMINLVYPQVKRPETLFKSMSGRFCRDDFSPLSREEAAGLLKTEGQWIIKPSLNSNSGKDIRFFDGPLPAEEAEKLLQEYASTDFVVQRVLKQHPRLGEANPTSINTIRLITLVFEEKAYILSGCLRVGGKGSRVDNMGAGGVCFPIRPDGSLGTDTVAVVDGKVKHISYDGDPLFSNYTIPCFDKVSATALELASRTPHLALIAWDLSVDEEGNVVLIEFNTNHPGQNQEICGPSFGDLTDGVLAQVFGGKTGATQ